MKIGGSFLAQLPVMAAVLLLAACSLHDRSGTIGSLEQESVDIDPQDVRLEADEQRAAELYRSFLEAGPRSELRPEALRRLAGLQLELAGTSAETAASAEEAAAAVELYESLLEAYPGRAGNDRVLYHLAQAYDQAGEPDKALSTLDRLVREWPESPFWVEAQFRRGERLFVVQDFAAAEIAYRAVLEKGAGSVFEDRALYKLGWTEFKRGRYEAGLEAFFRLLDRRLITPDGQARRLEAIERADREMIEDALRAVSLSFSYQGGAQALAAYFDRRGGRPYEALIYNRVGEFYLEQERFSDAAGIFEAYVARHPRDRQAPRMQLRVVEAYRKGRFPSLMLRARQEFAQRFALDGPYWQGRERAEDAEMVSALRKTVRELARYFHASAQQSRKADDYAQAIRWYHRYLQWFPKEADAAEINFLLAEAQFENGNYLEAAEDYERTAYEYPRHRHSAEAGYAALLAYEKAEESLEGGLQRAWRERAVDSALSFAGTFPDHPQALGALTRAAQSLFDMGDLRRAIEVARQVTGKPAAPSALQRTAWTITAHAAFDLGDYELAESAYGEAIDRLEPGTATERAMRERLAAAIYKQGEQARGVGALEEAVAHFLRVGQRAPGTSIVAVAEYDAAAGLIQLGRWTRAAEVLERFRKAFPAHRLQHEVTRKLAAVYLEAGQKARAAAEFARIAGFEKETGAARQAAWQAAELYREAGEVRSAILAYKHYVKRFPQPLEAAVEARWQLVQLYLGEGDRKRARHWLREIVRADATAGRARSDRIRYLAARSALELAGMELAGYKSIRLVEPLKRNLKRKKKRLEAVIAAYTRLADYGVAEVTTAATHQIAEVYRDFGQALMESERPRNLSGDALEQYEIMLEEQAYPFEEKAIEIFEANVRRIPEGTYDKWVRASLKRLAELLPVRYGKEERVETFVAGIR
ncbi:MAG TPA: tetratricopeptide repeat protein [Thiotrichales bacterium]|nr:tetratricopeptide repeat protein [Thiotrichales bacterium]